MPKFTKCLSEVARVNWAKLCLEHKVDTTEEDGRNIMVFGKIEDLEAIGKLMAEAPRGQ